MVPTLGIPYNLLKSNNFINAYVKDNRKDTQYENVVYLLFKPENLDRFREFLDNQYLTNKNIVEDYDYEGGYVVVISKLNPLFKEDFDLVRAGRYSTTSKKFQEQFPKLVKIVKDDDPVARDQPSLQFRIFRKTIEMRKYWEDKLDISFTDDMEVWRIFDEEKETLDFDTIKETILTT